MRTLITAPPDGGNVVVVSGDDPAALRLRLRDDQAAPFRQWFYARIATRPGTVGITLEGLEGSSYPGGWRGYDPCVSSDGATWSRVPGAYADGALRFEAPAPDGILYVAYFAPYGAARAQDFTARCAASPLAGYAPLGLSCEGQPIECLTIGEGARTLWVIGRQHPGESMGSWWMEGFLPRLLDEDDETASALRAAATVHVVPMMNPDGVAAGHLRTNAVGTDLNRAWATPCAASSPEVHAVREAMEAAGCDLFLDVHGDEAIANNFIAGAKGIPGWTERLEGLQDAFEQALLRATPDFQTREGYPIPAPGKANPRIATNWVAQNFDCLSMTLEMPFKDAAVNPRPGEGWSPARCMQLGRDCLTAMNDVVSALR